MQAIDVDGDSEIDFVAASSGNDKIVWGRNDGNENFAANDVTAASSGATVLDAIDLDGDDDIDVVSGSLTDGTVRWYENE